MIFLVSYQLVLHFYVFMVTQRSCSATRELLRLKMCAELCNNLGECYSPKYIFSQLRCPCIHVKHEMMPGRTKGVKIVNEIRNLAIDKKTMPQVCGEAPNLQNAQKMTEGHFTGAVTNYTCNTDYIPCLNKTTSVCQPTGQWEKVTGLCGQFRWNYPRIGSLYFLPCQLDQTFKVSVFATPQNTDRFSVNIKTEGDILMHADFRRNYPNYDNTIVFCSQIKGKWTRQEKTGFKMTLGHEMKIVITVEKRVFTLEVDGSVRYTYTCPVTEERQKYVKFEQDTGVSIRLLEFRKMETNP